MAYEPIIDPVSPDILEEELTPERFLRPTNKGGNLLFVTDAHSCPNVMREVGRLRECAFRHAGGGTGLECDIDEFDLMTPPCRQLIVWDPESRRILGGYRFICGEDIQLLPDGTPRIATGHLFSFSEEFKQRYLPHTLELGRSFVCIDSQATASHHSSKAIYVLDNLWDGLGALTVLHPSIKYLFGKVTMYPSYVRECRDMILYFLHKHFPDPDSLVTPIEPLVTDSDSAELARMFSGSNFKEDYKILNHAVRERGINIPPLVNAYMSLSPTMKCFGTAINREFGDVEETGIFLAVDEILEEKKRRHIESFTQVYS